MRYETQNWTRKWLVHRFIGPTNWSDPILITLATFAKPQSPQKDAHDSLVPSGLAQLLKEVACAIEDFTSRLNTWES